MDKKKERANAVFDILVEHAGVSEQQRGEFVYHFGTREFRFQGNLGFGGKLYNDDGDLSIGCYKEDYTPEREKIIEEVNELLANM